jgi:hypothetical protein
MVFIAWGPISMKLRLRMAQKLLGTMICVFLRGFYFVEIVYTDNIRVLACVISFWRH